MMLHPSTSNLEPFNLNFVAVNTCWLTKNGLTTFITTEKRQLVYFCDSDGSNVFTVRSRSISGAKCSRQKTSNSFPRNATVDCVFWWWRRSWQSCTGVVISHRLNNGGQHASKHPKHPCKTDRRGSPLTWKDTSGVKRYKHKKARWSYLTSVILLRTWIWKSEPFGFFQHISPGGSSRHVLRNAGIRRKPSGCSDDCTDYPRCCNC